LEMEQFGWTHAEASAMMARQWSLPERIAEMISSHAEAGSLQRGELPPPAACVACSALLPSSTDSSWAEQTMFLDVYRQLSGQQNTDIGQLLAQYR